MYKKAAIVGAAFAIVVALAGCGGTAASSSSSSSSTEASSSSVSTSSSSAASSSSSSTSSTSSSASVSTDYTAGNGTLDCEFCTLTVTGQGELDGAATLEATVVNKTDHKIHVHPNSGVTPWVVNGEEAYGSAWLDPEAGETVESYMWFLDADGNHIPVEGFTEATGEILVQDEDFQVIGRYEFSYTA